MLPQPPPSWNSVKTCLAGACLDETQSTIKKTKKLTVCNTSSIVSTIGSHLAQKRLKATVMTIKAMARSVACQSAPSLAFGLASSIIPFTTAAKNWPQAGIAATQPRQHIQPTI